ncbi:hypothetical protein PFISCL1PPCAC_5098, partial [Pristionchus fissidentatus]
IIIHFLETTPSVLRSSVIFLLYIPMRVINYSGYSIFDKNMSIDFTAQIPLYGYHLLIIIITLARSNTKLPFSLYLFDLMPS